MFSRWLRSLPAFAVGAALLGACGSAGEAVERFTDNRISFRYPEGWQVSGFSTSNSPRRLAVSSYSVPSDAVEGDCGGYEAVALLPPDGALVVLIDYVQGRSFPPRTGTLTMRDGEFAEYECFGASTMFRFRVGDRSFQAHVALGSEAGDEARDRALGILASLSVVEQPEFVPTTYQEGNRVILPVTFPDGTTAELVYPPELDIAGLGAFPYGSGALRGKSPTPGRGDFVGRDFWIRYGGLEDLLVRRNDGRPPMLLATYEGADGQHVGLWDLRADDTAHYLGFQFGAWAVLVYDYAAAGAMTDAERASWAASFAGRETDGDFSFSRRQARFASPGPASTPARGSPSRRAIQHATSSSCRASARRIAIRTGASTGGSSSGVGGSPTGACRTPCVSTRVEAKRSSAR